MLDFVRRFFGRKAAVKRLEKWAGRGKDAPTTAPVSLSCQPSGLWEVDCRSGVVR